MWLSIIKSDCVFADLKKDRAKEADIALRKCKSIYIASGQDFFDAEDYGIFRPVKSLADRAEKYASCTRQI